MGNGCAAAQLRFCGRRVVIGEVRLPPVPAAHHVIDGSCILDSRRSGHADSSAFPRTADNSPPPAKRRRFLCRRLRAGFRDWAPNERPAFSEARGFTGREGSSELPAAHPTSRAAPNLAGGRPAHRRLAKHLCASGAAGGRQLEARRSIFSCQRSLFSYQRRDSTCLQTDSAACGNAATTSGTSTTSEALFLRSKYGAGAEMSGDGGLRHLPMLKQRF